MYRLQYTVGTGSSGRTAETVRPYMHPELLEIYLCRTQLKGQAAWSRLGHGPDANGKSRIFPRYYSSTLGGGLELPAAASESPVSPEREPDLAEAMADPDPAAPAVADPAAPAVADPAAPAVADPAAPAASSPGFSLDSRRRRRCPRTVAFPARVTPGSAACGTSDSSACSACSAILLSSSSPRQGAEPMTSASVPRPCRAHLSSSHLKFCRTRSVSAASSSSRSYSECGWLTASVVG
jgi:hypothetical protein